MSDDGAHLQEPPEVKTLGENLTIEDDQKIPKSAAKRGRKPTTVPKKEYIKKREQKADIKQCSDVKMTIIQSQDEVTNFFT